MVTTLLQNDSCVGRGTGMATYWTLEGTTTIYDGDLRNTDGYLLTVSLLWR
jgi:hypothetical protein